MIEFKLKIGFFSDSFKCSYLKVVKQQFLMPLPFYDIGREKEAIEEIFENEWKNKYSKEYGFDLD